MDILRCDHSFVDFYNQQFFASPKTEVNLIFTQNFLLFKHIRQIIFFFKDWVLGRNKRFSLKDRRYVFVILPNYVRKAARKLANNGAILWSIDDCWTMNPNEDQMVLWKPFRFSIWKNIEKYSSVKSSSLIYRDFTLFKLQKIQWVMMRR